jgi:alpha-pyrone synthase
LNALLMAEVYLNQIATAVPDHDIHRAFVDRAPSLLNEERYRVLFRRMANRAQIEHRFSFLRPPSANETGFDADGFYRRGAFPDTKARMRVYESHAFTLAKRALDQLHLTEQKDAITHVIVTSCTGFYAPGLDLQVVQYYGLSASVERTIVGFMGCNAAINALKLARHIVRSRPEAKVVILNLELCTLHLQETDDLQQILSFLIFADGCAASMVSAEPCGIELQSFHVAIMPDSAAQITWHIGDLGFDMVLLGHVPATVAKGLTSNLDSILNGHARDNIEHWAIHPGGHTILNAVQRSVGVPDGRLRASRDILRRYGNMSSATVMFVLKEMMAPGTRAGQGCAMAFGPGVTVESMLFRAAPSTVAV